ncbi:MAG: DUF2341 domain-containing protein [Candidatus Parvarchaeota archaeon]|nr:DUF2341 domain-containing protein [Candidatus Parvarchaeum tengchongense]
MKSTTPAHKKGYKVHFTTFLVVMTILFIILFFLSTLNGFLGFNIAKLFGLKPITITAPKNISVTPPPTNTTNSTKTIPVPKYTIFYESGLPLDTLWSVSLPSGTSYSNVNYLNYSSFLKSFSFSVNQVFLNGCIFSPSPGSGNVIAGNSVYISFSSLCNTTFVRYGLPNKVNWTVIYGNVSKDVDTNSTSFISSNGNFPFSISDSHYDGCPYYPYPQSGYVNAGSSKYIIFFTTCSSKSNAVTFLESGLPQGYNWTVKYNNITNSSNSTRIVFTPKNSASLIPVFNVSVINKNNCIFTPNPKNGNATVGQTVLITFNSLCNTSVSENGLPVGTKWNVTFDNKTVYSVSYSLRVSTNYTLSNLSLKPIVLGNCTFNPIANSSNPIVAGSSVFIEFSASCITSFLEKNLPLGLNWTVKYDNKTLQSTSSEIKFNTTNVFSGFSIPNATEGGCVYSPTPSHGNLTAGSSITISFSQTCHTVFVSKGLPTGVSWSVDYDNQTRDGAFNSSIEFPYYKGKTFSYNVSTIKVGNCVFTPYPKNGTILAGELQLIAFSGECTTTFSETGLPNNTEWNATFDNKTKLSTSAGIYFYTVNGSYPFSIPSQPISRGCYYVPSPSSGSITAGSNETIEFTDDCTTDFIDPGLPQGANWTVTFAGLTKHSINQNVSFLLPKGKYYYQVPQTSYNGCNYAPNQSSGSTSVGEDVHITFNLTTCDTIFSEVGLPKGTSWQVIFNGTSSDSQTNSISFSSFPGNYSFSVGKITLGTCVFSPNESSGFINAGSSPVIGFSSLCYTDFYEKDLPVNSLWRVNYNGKPNSSIGDLIAIKTSYGTFPYSISNVSAGGSCYFIPQPVAGNDTAGTEVTVNYIEKCLSNFHETGLYSNVHWSVTYDGHTVSTYGNNLSILNLPGNYSYDVPTAFGRGCTFTSLNSSGNLVSGKNASVYFSPSSCISNVTETGLPKNVNWGVSIDNVTNYSTEKSILVTTSPGNYSVHIPSVKINGCVFSTSYNNLMMAGSTIIVHFSAACQTIFTETGLPNGTEWKVNDSFPSYFDYNLPIPGEVYSYTVYSSTTNRIIVNSSNSSANPYKVESIPINKFCAYDPQPSSGSITPGDNLSILFENDCITSFKETGLPSGATWYVSFNDINASSNSSQISFLTNAGAYNFKVFTAENQGCFYTSNVTQGTLNTSSVLNIKFTGKFCLTIFNETGLPSNTKWNVTFNSILKASNTSKITFNDSFSNNSYNYYIQPKSISAQGCYINLTSPSGTVKVGSYVNVTYLNRCKTTFNETGLPNSTKWSVIFDGLSGSSSNSSVVIYALPGNHSYTPSIINIGEGCFYYPKPNSSYLISGESASISYTKECLSTFSQNGLPSGALWSVKYDNFVNSSRLSDINFVTAPGNFSFSLNTVDYAYCSFLPSPVSGYLIAGGNVSISFIENTCNTTFIETGLPFNTQWKLTFDGITETPSNNNVTITTPAGIFTAKFYPINLSNCIFSPQPLSSSTAAGGYFTVHFTASCTTTFNETGLPNNTYWFVTYNGTTVSSNSTIIKVPSINGTYAYSLPFIGNSSCSYRPNPSSGNAIAGSKIGVDYSGGCTTVFYENGLPPGSEWNLTYDNKSINSTSTSIQFVTPPGTFRYTVENLTLNNCLYVAKNGSSELAAGSTFYLVFNQTRCYTTFTESNLPSNTKWTLNYDNVNYSSNKTSLELSTIPGTFNFTGYSITEDGCIFTPNPSSGHIAAGSSLLLSFSSSCVTSFNETGLSKGITWSVDFDGITNYSSNASLYIDSIYGNFSFSVPRIQVSANCYLTPDPSNGYIIAGSSTVINFSNYCYSEFIETGLPSGISWSVKYSNLTNSSSLSDISFNVISGNYSFSMPAVDYHNCYFVSNESSGYAKAGGYTYVKFTENYCISNFTESGLPSNTKWNVTFANKSNASTKQYIHLNTTKGLYNFTVPPVNIEGCKYVSTPASGSVAAGSEINVSFSISFCITTFDEIGLPLRDNWSVTYDSMRNSSVSSNITFNISTLSSFPFSVKAENQSQCDFIPVPSSGSVASGSTEVINFDSICHTYFKEIGLPLGYTWIVNLNGKNGSSKSNTIEFTTSYDDNYTFNIYPSVDYNSGFLSNISKGYIATGSNITVAFSNDTAAYKKPVIIPVSFYNNQTESTAQPYQQMLVFNSSKYSKYENSKLTNIMFAYPNGTAIPSWLESGNSNTSNDTVYWLKIKSIPAESGITINMIFNQTLLPYSNNFYTGIAGEAPQLSPIYGEYNNIANVMNSGLLYQFYQLNGGGIQSQTSVYQAQLTPNSVFSYGSLTATAGPTLYLSALTGSSQDVDGTTESNVIINYQYSYSGGSAFPNPPITNPQYVIMKAIGFAVVNSPTTIYGLSDDGMGIGYSNSGGALIPWLGGSSTSDNPNNIINSWVSESATQHSGTITTDGSYRLEIDYTNQGGPGEDAVWSNNSIDYYSPSQPPNGVMPYSISNATFITTYFKETGLPLNYNWNVNYNGIPKSSSMSEINFTTERGNYSYSVSVLRNSSSSLDCTTAYTPLPSSGYLIAGQNITISYSNSTYCITTLDQNGLPANSIFYVNYDGINKSISLFGNGLLLSIQNTQSVPTPAPFQQMVNFSYSSYKKYINLSNGHQFQNVEFINTTSGKVIDSWLESYTSSYALFWIKLPNGIAADTTVKNVAMLFLNNGTNLFNTNTTGEAPQLSPTYAEYDNGANVFIKYWNFNGGSAPAGFATSVDDGGSVSYNNGLYLTLPNNNNGATAASVYVQTDLSNPFFAFTGTGTGAYAYRTNIGISESSSNSIEGTCAIMYYPSYSYIPGGECISNGLYSITSSGYSQINSLSYSSSPLIGVGFNSNTVLMVNNGFNLYTDSSIPFSSTNYVWLGTSAYYSKTAGSNVLNYLALSAYPPNGVMPTITSVFQTSGINTSNGRFLAKPSSNIDCSNSAINLTAGSTYTFENWNCTTEFNTTDINQNVTFSLDYDGLNKSGITGKPLNINFLSSGNGNYLYNAKISNQCSASGYAYVGENSNISNWNCSYLFYEKNLPTGTKWYVSFNGFNESSANNKIVFFDSPGNYSYKINEISIKANNGLSCVNTFYPSPSSGYISTFKNNITIIFSNNTQCTTSFLQFGLPNNNWKVSYNNNGYNYTSTYTLINISISNAQSISTPAPFQQMVNFSYSSYKKYINLSNGHQFQNVEFINTTSGKVIDSWLESYTSSYAVFWIKLPNGIPASSTLTDIAIGFASNDTNLFNNKTIGEAPQLSPTYAEYDNGANVFDYYENFAGSGLPAGWQELTSSGDTYTWNNGITFTNNGHNDYVSIGTTSAVASAGILELDVASGSNARPTIELAATDTQIEGGQPIYEYEEGYGQSYGMYSGDMQLETLTTSSISTANSKTAYNAPLIEGISWTATGSELLEIIPNYLYNNMETVQETSTSVSLSTPLYVMLGQAASGSSSDTGGFTANWLRVRAYPPNGVMPTVKINKSSVTDLKFNFLTVPGNFTANASTSLDCKPEKDTVKAGTTYFFSSWNCTTTFNESVLPKDNTWWVDYNGINKSNKTGNAIRVNFNSSNFGIYTYSVGSNISCSSKGVGDLGTYNNISNWLCNKQFTEQGLPSGTNWSVDYNNKLSYSTSNVISFSNSFGNYSYDINNITLSNAIYVPNSSSGYAAPFGNFIINFSKHSLVTPQTIYKYAVLNITNSQNYLISAPFQQMVNLSYSSYKQYINLSNGHQFQNVEFFNTTTGSVIDSWLESYTSSYALFWIKLPNGIPANTTLNDIAIGFASNDTNLFNNKTTGEAPQLSSTYAEYDNGANVFDIYFNGAVPTSDFTLSGSEGSLSSTTVTGPNGNTIDVLEYAQASSSLSYLAYNVKSLNSGSYITEASFQSDGGTSNTGVTGLGNYESESSSSSAIYVGTQFGGDYFDQDYLSSGSLKLDQNSQGTTNADWRYASLTYVSSSSYSAYIAPQLYSASGGYNEVLSEDPISSATTIYWDNYASAGDGSHVYYNWVRIRAYPPNGVMPSVKLNALVTKPITLFIDGISNSNVTTVYGRYSNLTVESSNNYVKIWKETNNSVMSLTHFSMNVSTYSNIFAAGKVKIIGGSNSTNIKNVSYYNIINKATPILNLVSNPDKNYSYNGTSLIINASISTIGNQLNAELYINGIFNQTINKSTVLNLSSYADNYTIVLNTSGNQNYTAGSITITRDIYPQLPSSLSHYMPINITNTKAISTAAPFQQMVNLSYSSYKQYINLSSGHQFQNVEFINRTNDKVIESWLENYTSGYAIFWIKLPNGIPASSTLTDIAIGFASNDTNLFNNKTTGEAPQLSPNYAEYDNGANVFNFYDNFAGTSLNINKWNSGASGGTITVNNGLTETIPYNASTGSFTYISTASYTITGPAVVESYANLNSFDTTDFRIVPIALTQYNNTAWHADNEENENAGGWVGDAFQRNGIDAETTNSSSYNGFVDSNYISPNSNYNIFGVIYPANNTLGVSYNSLYSYATTTSLVPSTPLYITVSNWLYPPQTAVSTTYPINVYWVLSRAYSPNGVMPSVSFGGLLQ